MLQDVDPPGAIAARVTPGRPPSALRSFTLVATGDILLHPSVISRAKAQAKGTGAAYDFRPMFASVRPVIASADLAICHLETPVAPPGTPLSTYPIYGVPAEIAPAIRWAGYDRCSTASNHSLDRGTKGIDATLAALDAQGVGHSGTARRPAEGAPTIFTVSGVRVAHLSYSFGFNGFSLPVDQPWRANLIDPQRIIAEARQAKADGAEFVVVSLHWGIEGSSTVTPEQAQWADLLTRSGAIDLIIGHHAHVLQPIEAVNGRWVVFGLGNFLSGMGTSAPCCGPRAQDGAIVRIKVVEQPGGFFVANRPEVIPTYVGRPDYVIRPVSRALAAPATSATAALRQSLRRTEGVLGPYMVAG